MEKDVKAITPHNLGWLEYKLNTQEMDYIWKCIENKKQDYKQKHIQDDLLQLYQ